MALPKPKNDVPVDRDRSKLAPKFNERLDQLLLFMEQNGHDPFIYEAVRTNERQEFLYGFGREYDDGRGIVTHSRTAQNTWHFYGLAVDIISKSKLWNAPQKFWDDLRTGCYLFGLRHGDDWDMDGVPVRRDPDESFSDKPHVQWGKPMRRSPSPRAAELYQAGGLRAVWREVGAA